MTDPAPSRRPRTHVFIVDGTLSTLEPGQETHAGRLFRLLSNGGRRADLWVDHHPGVQGRGPRGWIRAAIGLGLNDAILDGYARLSSRWRPGDRIFLYGYSRGAYAVRSLAGLIGFVGLLRPEEAIHRRVHRAFRIYESGSAARAAQFAAHHCHRDPVDVDLVGVWDTVKALGIPWPVLSFLHPMATEFHDHRLGGHVRNGLHALALDEDRVAFRPETWDLDGEHPGRVEQVWFPGAHGDVGGHVGGFHAARPLSEVSLAWMLERSEALGLPLPADWRAHLAPDPAAPMHGARRGVGRMYVIRQPRRVRSANGEVLHPSVALRMVRLGYAPRAEGALPPDPCLPGDAAQA
ncbi:DUF2235 domain-containing protein [Albimonas sp. CAU 1670]|uniref:DUF2235 domain-containing protein n=1 Tax=Albimonas sp. CAU 1670 TaxID=3032599 RepID=UPI0023DA2EBB|nr:DUF2235 domain-containing protein [Albimonas sp. CAU 1670]MDF2234477.1 DUF2235 domain-containing protein [Albimonas sp. CAU 1670]